VITHPTTGQIVDVVARWIDALRPSLTGRDAFMARVAVNALGIVGRELANGQADEAAATAAFAALLGKTGAFEDLNAELCRRLREGEMDRDTPGLLAALDAAVSAQIAIDQPNYKPDQA
jgi:hypothetical protein